MVLASAVATRDGAGGRVPDRIGRDAVARHAGRGVGNTARRENPDRRTGHRCGDGARVGLAVEDRRGGVVPVPPFSDASVRLLVAALPKADACTELPDTLADAPLSAAPVADVALTANCTPADEA